MKLSTFIKNEYWPYAEMYLKPDTLRVYRSSIDVHIVPRFGKWQMHRITRRDVELWLIKLQKESPVAGNRALSSLSAIMTLAVRRAHIEWNPCLGARRAREQGRKRFLSPQEIQKVKDALPSLAPAEAAFILVLMYTGARPGELRAVDQERIAKGVILLEDSKTGQRSIYLPSQVQMALELYHKEFGKINHQVLMQRLRRLTGIKDFRLYDFRHTFASMAVAGGCTLEQIGQLLGHSNYQTTKRYAHLIPETGREAVAKAAKALG